MIESASGASSSRVNAPSRLFMGRYKLILIILALAFFLRIFDIQNNPKSMYGDELTLLLDAQSILKTGYDNTGEFLPLHFSMGGGRPAGYIYATIPYVSLFGPTTLAVKAVSILSGLGIVALLYLICSQFLSKNIGIFAAILAAITPWELSMSRGGFESHFALFLSLLGFYLFIKAKEKKGWLFFSALFFALAMHTYSTYTLTIPIFALFLLFTMGVKKVGIFIPIILLSLILGVYLTLNRGSSDRFSNLNIFSNIQIQDEISGKIAKERIFEGLKISNKYTETIGIFIENYAKNFSPEFLFVKGDENPRHNPASMGGLFWFQLPLLILGLVYLYSKYRKVFYLSLGWLAVAPIAGSLVGEAHFLRNSFMLPPLLILCAAGLEKLRNFRLHPWGVNVSFVVGIIFLAQLPFFINRFYILAPNLYASFWSYSAKVASDTAMESKNKYDHIILSASIPDMEFAYPTYAKVKPSDVQAQNSSRTKIGEFDFFKYGNVYIGSIPASRIRETMNTLPGSVLYLGIEADRGQIENEKIQRDRDGSILYVSSEKN